jgi:hypothetical protein
MITPINKLSRKKFPITTTKMKKAAATGDVI